MAIKEKRNKTQTLTEAMNTFPHVRSYLMEWVKNNPMPTFVPELNRSMKKLKSPNLIYPVGDPIFIHIFREPKGTIRYNVIEPRISEEQLIKYDRVLDKMVEVASQLPIPHKVSELKPILEKLYDKIVVVEDKVNPLRKLLNDRIVVTQVEYDTMKYQIIRNRAGYGPLEPLFFDPHPEDIHCVGVGEIKLIHRIFGMVYTNIIFKDDVVLNKFVIEMSERVERPASDANSVIDAMMPDGSRANFIYGRDISLEGSSFTLRKFQEVPVSVTQVVNWGTMSSQVAAYLWLSLENGMNLFVCGETASGKTTTLNAISAFIKPLDKVYTVENTPEVTMPHDTWQHLLTREAGKSSDVTYMKLLIAALRSRPDYIIVGEIRGEEGNIAFQAMQTGHPVMSTFHAGSVSAMIQRITGHPINVPLPSVDNLNICLIQMAVTRLGQRLRRVLSVTELERFYAPEQKVVTRQVFEWDPLTDKHMFKGYFNSYILEEKIAKMIGIMDTRDIYKELALRKKIIDKMIENEIFNYYDVWELIKNYHTGGAETLPFSLEDEAEL